MRTLTPQDIQGKKVFLRCDFNVPIASGVVGDISRIRMTLPTIQFLLDHDAIVILASHLGRPKGTVVEELRLKPIQEALEKELNRPVWYNGEILSQELSTALENAKKGDIFLLENIQFDPGECEGSKKYARALAGLADVYINDAFGQSHRDYASLVSITEFLPSFPGFLMEKEVQALQDFVDNIQSPGVIVMGGVKIETKLPVIKNLIKYADTFLFGGGIANTLLYAAGYEIGESLAEKEKLTEAQDILLTIEQNKDRYLLPIDAMVMDANKKTADLSLEDIKSDMRILDIGRQTEEVFLNEIAKANTIIWNGPLGYIEDPQFCHSTKRIVTAIANSKAATLVGGGDTLDTLAKFRIDHELFTHVSSGGGAMLTFLEGTVLPGIKALQ